VRAVRDADHRRQRRANPGDENRKQAAALRDHQTDQEPAAATMTDASAAPSTPSCGNGPMPMISSGSSRIETAPIPRA